MSRFKPSPEFDRIRPAEDSPRNELESVRRTLDDLAAPDKAAPRPGGVVAPLAWVVLALIALMAFVGWLLFGPPLPH